MAPNEIQGSHQIECSAVTIMNCCLGNALWELYRVWRDMARFDPDTRTYRLHLLLNKADRHADVYSWLPNAGRVEVKPELDRRVAIRIPEWVSPAQCEVRVAGQARKPQWEGRYAVVSAAKGETVRLDCPISECMETCSMLRRDWTLTIRGNTVVGIDPPGQYGRIHHHPEYRADEPAMVERERYTHPVALDLRLNPFGEWRARTGRRVFHAMPSSFWNSARPQGVTARIWSRKESYPPVFSRTSLGWHIQVMYHELARR